MFILFSTLRIFHESGIKIEGGLLVVSWDRANKRSKIKKNINKIELLDGFEKIYRSNMLICSSKNFSDVQHKFRRDVYHANNLENHDDLSKICLDTFLVNNTDT